MSCGVPKPFTSTNKSIHSRDSAIFYIFWYKKVCLLYAIKYQIIRGRRPFRKNAPSGKIPWRLFRARVELWRKTFAASKAVNFEKQVVLKQFYWSLLLLYTIIKPLGICRDKTQNLTKLQILSKELKMVNLWYIALKLDF